MNTRKYSPALSRHQHDEAIRLRRAHRLGCQAIADRVGATYGQINWLFRRLSRDGVVDLPTVLRDPSARRRHAALLYRLKERVQRLERSQCRQSARALDGIALPD